MIRFVIYAEQKEDARELEMHIRKTVHARGECPLIHSFIGVHALPDYLKFVEKNPFLVMIVAAPGLRGREAAHRIRDNNPKARMLWFSDHGNGIYSYNVTATHFGLLPVTRETVELSMDACGIYPQVAEDDP